MLGDVIKKIRLEKQLTIKDGGSKSKFHQQPFESN